MLLKCQHQRLDCKTAQRNQQAGFIAVLYLQAEKI